MASASRGEIPKNAGVEVGGVVEEAALAGVDGARARPGPGRRAPSRSQPRSAGKPAIASRAGGDQLPQLLGGAHAAGEAAAHADDRDRVVVGGRGAATGARPPVPPLRRRAARRAGGRRAPAASGSRRPGWRAAAARWRRSSRLRSSTAVSESKPRSRKARPALDRVGAGVAEHGGHLRSRTRSSSARSLLGLGQPGQPLRAAPSRRRRGLAGGVAGRRAWRPARPRAGRASSGLGRPAVKAGANRSQSTSATVTAASPWSSGALQRGRWPASGAIGGRPRAAQSAAPAPSSAAMPPLGPRAPGERGGGQALGRGAARRARRGRRWPRRSWPGPRRPTMPAIEENSTNAARSRSARQLVQVRAPRPPSARSTRGEAAPASARRARRRPAPRRVCTTAVSGARPASVGQQPRPARRGRRRRRRRRSPGRPSAASSARSSAAPGASRPRRLVSTRCSAPLAGQPAGHVRAQRAGAAGDQHRAARRPGRSAAGAGRRGPHQPAAEHARTAGPRPGPRRRPRRAPPASRASARSSGVSGRSTRPPQRSGSSSAGDPAEAPDQRLRRVATSVVRTPGRRPRRGWRTTAARRSPASPRACTRATVAQPGGQRRCAGSAAVQGQQREHAGARPSPSAAVAQPLGACRRSRSSSAADVDAASARVGARHARLGVGGHDQPGPVSDASARRQRLPRHAVAPAVHVDARRCAATTTARAAAPPATAPSGPGLGERPGPPLDGLPEAASTASWPAAAASPPAPRASSAGAGRRRWAGRRGGRRCRRRTPSQSTARPATCSAGEGGGQRSRPRGGPCAAAETNAAPSPVDAVLRHGGQHAVRAQLEERGDALGLQRPRRRRRSGRPRGRAAPSSRRSRAPRRRRRAPVRLETTGMRGASYVSALGDLRGTSSSIGVHPRRVEGVADREPLGLAALRLEAPPRPPATASSSPETTTGRGPLTAAIDDPLGRAAAAPRPRRPATATIAPPAGSACISRPRAATSCAASASDSTPATCAAASSPIEWPDQEVRPSHPTTPPAGTAPPRPRTARAG